MKSNSALLYVIVGGVVILILLACCCGISLGVLSAFSNSLNEPAVLRVSPTEKLIGSTNFEITRATLRGSELEVQIKVKNNAQQSISFSPALTFELRNDSRQQLTLKSQLLGRSGNYLNKIDSGEELDYVLVSTVSPSTKGNLTLKLYSDSGRQNVGQVTIYLRES